MPVNWDKFEREIDSIIDRGAERADIKLAEKVSSMTRMTDEEVKELFPEPADVQKLARLLKIVKSAEAKNTKINKIVDNAEEFGETILTLIGKFI